ncbi:MAG: hypothetical protein ACOCTN_07810 [Candidatus Natronoplasma sp.]
MIEKQLLRLILGFFSIKNNSINSWNVGVPFFQLTFLICVSLFILFLLLLAVLIFLLMREFNKGSTRRCPYCGERIPTDAAWCKYCKRDLTEDFTPGEE